MSERGPLYQYIEFCRNVETLWHKLESGHWDWLGRKPDGQFVLGRPRRYLESTVGVLSATATEQDAQESKHGVRVYKWHGQPSERPDSSWYTEPTKAKQSFTEMVRSLKEPTQSPILARVVLIEQGQVTDERFIAQTPPPNYQ